MLLIDFRGYMKSTVPITIFIVMILGVAATPVLVSAATQDAMKSAETDSLTRSELVELRKTTLLQEIQSYQPGATSRFLHKWELRLLLLALTAGYVAYRVKEQRPSLVLNGIGLLMATAVILLSMYYDAHVSSLSETVKQRKDILYENLYSLPNLTYSELRASGRAPAIEELRGGFWSNLRLKLGQLKKLDSVLFYLVVICVWILAHKGIRKGPPS